MEKPIIGTLQAFTVTWHHDGDEEIFNAVNVAHHWPENMIDDHSVFTAFVLGERNKIVSRQISTGRIFVKCGDQEVKSYDFDLEEKRREVDHELREFPDFLPPRCYTNCSRDFPHYEWEHGPLLGLYDNPVYFRGTNLVANSGLKSCPGRRECEFSDPKRTPTDHIHVGGAILFNDAIKSWLRDHEIGSEKICRESQQQIVPLSPRNSVPAGAIETEEGLPWFFIVAVILVIAGLIIAICWR